MLQNAVEVEKTLNIPFYSHHPWHNETLWGKFTFAYVISVPKLALLHCTILDPILRSALSHQSLTAFFFNRSCCLTIPFHAGDITGTVPYCF